MANQIQNPTQAQKQTTQTIQQANQMAAFAMENRDYSLPNVGMGVTDTLGSIYAPVSYSGNYTGTQTNSIFQSTGNSALDLYNEVRMKCDRISREMAAMSASRSTNNGVTTPQQTQPETLKESNPFSKLSDANINELKGYEKDLKEKNKELKETTDAEKKKKLAKEILDIQSKYDALERKCYFKNGKTLSQLFGTKYNFYKNLSAYEQQGIKDANAEIEALQEELTKLEKAYAEKHDEVTRETNEFIQKNGRYPNPDEISDEETREYLKNTPNDIQAKKQEISDKIKMLESYAKKAGKADNKDIGSWYLSQIADQGKIESERKKAEIKTDAQGIYGGDDNSIAKGNRKLNEVLTKLQEKYPKADVKTVEDFIREYAKTSSALTQKDNQDKAFFEAIATTFIPADDDSAVEKTKKLYNLKLLEDFYNERKAQGEKTFKDRVAEFTNNAGIQQIALTLKDADKKIAEDAKKAEEAAAAAKKKKTDGAGENTPPPAANGDGDDKKVPATPKTPEQVKAAIQNGDISKVSAEDLRDFLAQDNETEVRKVLEQLYSDAYNKGSNFKTSMGQTIYRDSKGSVIKQEEYANLQTKAAKSADMLRDMIVKLNELAGTQTKKLRLDKGVFADYIVYDADTTKPEIVSDDDVMTASDVVKAGKKSCCTTMGSFAEIIKMAKDLKKIAKA